jgi:8-oxo-dGTP pyrophosphatase MutT (NUDIX family)
MPQGGIDPYENPRVAALRELREETGITNASIVASVREPRPAGRRRSAPALGGASAAAAPPHPLANPLPCRIHCCSTTPLPVLLPTD